MPVPLESTPAARVLLYLTAPQRRFMVIWIIFGAYTSGLVLATVLVIRKGQSAGVTFSNSRENGLEQHNSFRYVLPLITV